MQRKIASSIQYWLYSVLATRFGKSLSLNRSYVARMYEVNRHDFEAQPEWNAPGDRYAYAAEIHRFAHAYLIAAGYLPREFGAYVKQFVLKGQPVEAAITLRYEPQVYGTRNDTVSFGVSVHKLPATLEHACKS